MFRWKTERNTKYYCQIRYNRLNGRSQSEKNNIIRGGLGWPQCDLPANSHLVSTRVDAEGEKWQIS